MVMLNKSFYLSLICSILDPTGGKHHGETVYVEF
jgi:hypothetical protein